MKKTALFLLLITSFGYSQNRYSETTTSSYTPLSLDEVMYVGKQKRSQYNENQKYLYALKDWIRNLSSQVEVKEFHDLLQNEYNDLVKIENQDLAKYSTYLRQTEDAVKEIINDYNVYLREYNKRSSRSYELDKDQLQHLMTVSIDAYDAGIRGNTGAYEIAEIGFSKYLEIDKNNTDVLYYRAKARRKLKKYYEALSDYYSVINLNSQYPVKVVSLSQVLKEKEEM